LVVAVQDTEADIKQFLDDGGWTFPVALLPDDVRLSYGVRGVPTLFLVDADGRIAKTFVGGVTAAKLSELVDDLTS
jgi:hypothetical protein